MSKAKRYLQKIRTVDLTVRALEQELLELRYRVQTVGNIDLNNIRGKDPDKLERRVVKLLRKEEKYQEELARLYELKEAALIQIEKIEDDTLKHILKLRYIRCMTIEEIADEMHYSNRWITSLHKKALAAFEKCSY